MTDKETMQIMLQDVIDQFAVNPQSRSSKDDGSCLYMPPNEKSPGCAIGMYLNNKTAEKLDRYGSIYSILKVKKYRELLPKWMIKLNKDFLGNIQNFHDNSYNFTEKGISQSGLIQLKFLCLKFSLDMPKIKKGNLPE